MKQIGSELGVRYVLEGSVRRSGDQIRLNVQLIDAETDEHLWAERFDRHVSGLFALQDEITTAIVSAIEPELLKSERDRFTGQSQRSEEADNSIDAGSRITSVMRKRTVSRRRRFFGVRWRSTRNLRRPRHFWRSRCAVRRILAGLMMLNATMTRLLSWPSRRLTSIPAIR